MKRGVSELVNARLPGDRVKITIVPMVKPPSGQEECLSEKVCSSALPLICAWRPLVPQPVAADHALFVASMQFLTCDLIFGGAAGPGAVGECARRAGLDADDLERCASGERVVDTLRTSDFGGQIVSAVVRLKQAGFADSIAMPWVFLDDSFLQCAGDGCTGTMWPSGAKPLENPGSLLYLVCSRLEPKPEACLGVHAGYSGTPAKANVGECETCVQVGALRWQRARRGALPHLSWLAPAATLLAAAVAGRCGWASWRAHQRSLGNDFELLATQDSDIDLLPLESLDLSQWS